MQSDAGSSFQNIITISRLTPDALVCELISRYSVTIPEQISSTDDLKEAGILLGRLANIKTFLYSLLSYLKVAARQEKAKGRDARDEAERLAMNRDAVELMLDAVKGQYDAVSRMLTAHKMELDELRMLGLTG